MQFEVRRVWLKWRGFPSDLRAAKLPFRATPHFRRCIITGCWVDPVSDWMLLSVRMVHSRGIFGILLRLSKLNASFATMTIRLY